MIGVASHSAKIAMQIQKEHELKKARKARKNARDNLSTGAPSSANSVSSSSSMDSSKRTTVSSANSIKGHFVGNFKSAMAKRKAQHAGEKAKAAQAIAVKAAAKAEAALIAAKAAMEEAEKAKAKVHLKASRRGSASSLSNLSDATSSMAREEAPSPSPFGETPLPAPAPAPFEEAPSTSGEEVPPPSPSVTESEPEPEPKSEPESRRPSRSRSRSRGSRILRSLSRSLSRKRRAPSVTRTRSSAVPKFIPKIKSALRGPTSGRSIEGMTVSFSNMADVVVLPWELGDNPSVSAGPPLTVGWTAMGRTQISTNRQRMEIQDSTRIYDRPGVAGKIGKEERMRIIRDTGDYTTKEIQTAIAKAMRCKRLRNDTARQVLAPSTMNALKSVLRPRAESQPRQKIPDYSDLEMQDSDIDSDVDCYEIILPGRDE